MRTRRFITSVVLAVTVLAALAGSAAAIGANCVGTLASGNAGPSFGAFVAESANVARPLGRNFVAPAASSNDCSAIPIP